MNKQFASDFELTNVVQITEDVFDEFSLANRVGTPSVIFVLYGIQTDKEAVKMGLRPQIIDEGLKPVIFSFEMYNDHLEKGLPCFADKDLAVCIDVSKLTHGENNVKDLISVLTSNKNKIIQNKIKLLVWMTCEEAIEFSHTSPDLWTFRHRMFDLNLNYCAISVDEEENMNEYAKTLIGGFDQVGEGLVNISDTGSENLGDPKVQRILTDVTMALIKQDQDAAASALMEGISVANELADDELEELFARALNFIQMEQESVLPMNISAQVSNVISNAATSEEVLDECDAFLQKNDRYSAIKVLTDHLEKDPTSDVVWEKLGDVYANFKIDDKAIEAYERVTCGCVDLSAVALKKADCYVRLGQGEKAIDIYKAAIRVTDDEVELVSLWNKVGDAYTKMNKHEEAIAAYSYADHRDLSATQPTKALLINSNIVNSPQLSAEMWNEIGNIFVKTEDDQEAIVAYKRSIDIDPSNGFAYGNLAQVYGRQGNHREAQISLRQGIRLSQEKKQIYELWNLLGDDLRVEGNIDDAMLAYQNADLIRTGSRVLIDTKQYSNYSMNVRL